MLQHLSPSWTTVLEDQFAQPYWAQLESFVAAQRLEHPGRIYPPAGQVFAAFNHVSFEQVRVVLLGQDPYHGPGQAHGLSFSVPPDVKQPPSLRNVFKELQDDLGIPPPEHGTLSGWADQGVLLLNTVLTVRDGQPHSHRKRGWETLTSEIVGRLGRRAQPTVFVLWGAAAIKQRSLIEGDRHAVIQSVHPSPLSAHRGFFGSQPFSQVNAALRAFGHPTIDWGRTITAADASRR